MSPLATASSVTSAPFSPGARLGRYEILAPLGAGGMGRVYRALDTMLGREVAIKALPEAFAHHPQRLARFSREARVLASLSHPNIAVVHSLERVDDSYYLEMELVRGETLADRIAAGAIGPDEALRIFRQIAEAVEAAHGQGIVHRDLKPGNIMITPDGVVKILDFGLAKVLAGEDSAGGGATLPGAPSAATEIGVIVGTAAYMSPEQACGDAVDRRTDIWAFGCVLYEALTGHRAFSGHTSSDTVAAVLREEPDWARLAAVAPAKWQTLIRRCLQKNPRSRLHDIADARIEIEDISREPLAAGDVEPARRPVARTRTAAVAIAAAVAAGLLGAALTRWLAEPRAAAPSLARLMITVPAGHTLERARFSPIALSPDGKLLVYAAAPRGEQTQLYIRRLDEVEARPVAETNGASTPFFSPDGRWLAFYADGSLRKVSLTGGVPLTIAATPPVWSATWGGSSIVFATTLPGSGLWMVSSNGGEPAEITSPAAGELQHGYPQILNGGTHVLFSAQRAEGWQPVVLSLANRDRRVIGADRVIGEGAQYLPTGHLVYAQSGGLVAARFEAPDGELDTLSIPLLERVEVSRFGGAYFAVASESGSLVYVPAGGEAASRTLVRVDREGRAAPVLDARMGFEHPMLSPDGRRVAVTITSENGSDIWIIDLERGTRSRFTSGNTSAFPVWTPDGSRLAYQSTAPGPWTLYWQPLDQSSGPQPLLSAARPLDDGWPDPAVGLLPGTPPSMSGAHPQFPMSWAPGQSALAIHERKPNGERDIWIVGSDERVSPFLLTSFDERSPRFSPDGRWLAYVSNESGRDEVYVQPYPGPGPKWPISVSGGVDPVWSRDGRELFYRQDDRMMVVSIASSGGFSATRPRRLFDVQIDAGEHGLNYDVAPDGSWFLMSRGEGASTSETLHVVLNWFEEVRTLTLAGR